MVLAVLVLYTLSCLLIVEKETLVDTRTWAYAGTTMMIYSEVIQENSMTKGSQLCKFVGDLSLAKANIETKL